MSNDYKTPKHDWLEDEPDTPALPELDPAIGHDIRINRRLVAEMRQMVREELDRKPDGWREYAEAAIAAIDYNARTGDAWNVHEQSRLSDAAHEARKKYHAQRPS